MDILWQNLLLWESEILLCAIWDAMLTQTLHLCCWGQQRSRSVCQNPTRKWTVWWVTSANKQYKNWPQFWNLTQSDSACFQYSLALRYFNKYVLRLSLEWWKEEGESMTRSAPETSSFLQTEDELYPRSSHILLELQVVEKLSTLYVWFAGSSPLALQVHDPISGTAIIPNWLLIKIVWDKIFTQYKALKGKDNSKCLSE